jgi:prepilin signal peptidase PulO-like enzyme (type II secretory pathway)
MLFTLVIVGIIGLVSGGVVNALADDLPYHRNPSLPHYPDGAPRPVSTWLGLAAFLLGKRTSPSGAKLSWRSPIAEVLTALAMILTVLRTNDGHPVIGGLQIVFWLFYMAVFVLIVVIDIEHKLILFAVIIPSAIIAILDAILTPTLQGPTLQDALVGGAAGFIVFFILYTGGFLFTYVIGKLRGEGITTVAFGYGDVMMATLSGLILGWRELIFAMFITVFLGAFGALIYLVTRNLVGKRYHMFTAIPYGPYIVAGTFIMLLFSSEMACLLVRQC